MEIEKMEILGFDVTNLEEAIEKFSDLLGTTFHNFGEGETLNLKKNLTGHANLQYEKASAKAAIDHRGFIELVESVPPVEKDSIRNIHFKVSNFEEAIEEVMSKGYRLVANLRIGGLREAVFHPDDLCGVRLCLVEYKEATLVDAMLAGEARQEK